MNNRDALFIMNLLPELGPLRVQSLMEHYPQLGDALGASAADLECIPKLTARCAQVLHNWERYCDPAREESLCRQNGIYVVTLADDVYPQMLRDIHDPPICLYVRGSLDALQNGTNAIALVGSRNMTQYGATMAENISRGACQAGWVVVSGLARGIDTVAHSTSVSCGGKTVAVLGSGLLKLYPQENLQLASRIVECGGAIITEYPLDEGPDRRHFPQRNRIISGLTRGTIVVEAGVKSGSLITASQALEQGRCVFAVPGNADRPFSRGCHALLKDGARLTESFQDILDEFELTPTSKDREMILANHERVYAAPEKVAVSEKEWQVWNAIGEYGRPVDELVVVMDIPAASLLGILLNMEIKQLIRQLPGQRVERDLHHVAEFHPQKL